MQKPVKGELFKLRSGYTDQSLSQSYTSAFYSHSGKCNLHGFKFQFENTAVNIRVDIDGNTVLDESLDDLDDFYYADFDAGSSNKYFNRPSYGVIEFFPPVPLEATVSLDIYIKKNVSWDLELERYNIFVEEW